MRWMFQDEGFWYVSCGRKFDPSARSLRTAEDPRRAGKHAWEQLCSNRWKPVGRFQTTEAGVPQDSTMQGLSAKRRRVDSVERAVHLQDEGDEDDCASDVEVVCAKLCSVDIHGSSLGIDQALELYRAMQGITVKVKREINDSEGEYGGACESVELPKSVEVIKGS